MTVRIEIDVPKLPDEVMQTLSVTGQKHIRALEAVIDKLIKELENIGTKLEKEVREGKRQATPFRRDDKKKNKKRKKAGRKGGHTQQRRKPPKKADETYQVPHPDNCPHCAGAVEPVKEHVQIQEDIVSQVIVRKFIVTEGCCIDCGKKVIDRHPLQTSTASGNAAQQIGPTALALAAELHYGQGVPFDKIREHLMHLGLQVETSTLVRAMERIAHRAKATFSELMEKVLQQDVIHIDETGWSVAGEPCYLWVISGKEATIYFIRKTRSSDEVSDFLKDFFGVMVTDGAKAYDKLGKKLIRALCLLHLKRNVRTLLEQQSGAAVRFPRAVLDWLDKAMKLVSERDALAPEAFERRARRLNRRFDKILSKRVSNAKNERMLHRLIEWQDAVLRCLKEPNVPATNNHAEQKIRPGVVIRKRGGCNRSEKGARTFEAITSALVSCRQQGVDFVNWLVGLLRQPQPYASRPFW